MKTAQGHMTRALLFKRPSEVIDEADMFSLVQSTDEYAFHNEPIEGQYGLIKWWFDGELLRLAKTTHAPHMVGRPSRNAGKKGVKQPRRREAAA